MRFFDWLRMTYWNAFVVPSCCPLEGKVPEGEKGCRYNCAVPQEHPLSRSRHASSSPTPSGAARQLPLEGAPRVHVISTTEGRRNLKPEIPHIRSE